ALLEFFQQAHEPLEQASAATALGLIGHAEAMEPILEALCRSGQPVFRRQLAVAVGDLLGPAHTFYSVLDQETKVLGQSATRSVRQLRRVVRRASAGVLPEAWAERLGAVEAAYLAEAWPECARRLAALSGHIDLHVDTAPMACRLLAWLGRHADDAGFEVCALGMYALERLAGV
ncbi:hypothetical protein HQ560_20165, partial [bacterium]|nr:hypothetical protein [bacterium]